MPKETGTIDLKAQKAARDDAAKYATDYITEISGDGIWVTPEDAKPVDGQATSATTGWHISDALELVKAGVKAFRVWLDNGMAKLRLGEGDRSHLDLDYHSMQMVDRNGNVYFWVSDVTDSEGYITETFYGDGSTREFLLVDDIEQGQDEWYMTVSVDGNAVTSGFTRLTNGVRFASPPNQGSVVEIRYLPTTSNIKAYTLGQRRGKSAIGIFSVAEGYGTTASGNYSHAEGYNTTASDDMSHAEGYGTTASDDYSHAEGYNTTASGTASHAEGSGTLASGTYTHAEGYGTKAFNPCSHAEGENTYAVGSYCHAEGNGTKAYGNGSHAEGNGTQAFGDNSHAEGEGTTVVGDCSCGHAEGYGTRVESSRAHAEGSNTTASGGSSHAEGGGTTASGYRSHAEGDGTTASGYRSHAQNYGTIAASASQTALGKYNVEDANGTYAVIIGNGTADSARSDAARLKWTGDLLLAGDVKNLSGTNRYANASHGNHVPTTQTADNATYLRNDNTWHKITPADIGAAAASHNHDASAITSGELAVARGGSGMSGTTTTTAVASIIAAASGITVTAANYAQWGKVAHLVIDFNYDQAITVPANGNIANVTVGTLVAGKRPVYFKAAHSNGDGAGQQWYGITAAGVVTLRALEGTGSQRTVAAGTTLSISAVYLLP